jgi:hypothetical protein
MIDEVGGGAFHPDFHAAESAYEKIGIEVFATKLAIGDGLQPNFLLLLDNPLNGGILDGLKIERRDPSCGAVLPSLLERRRPQQAADVVSPKRRIVGGGCCHGAFSITETALEEVTGEIPDA